MPSVIGVKVLLLFSFREFLSSRFKISRKKEILDRLARTPKARKPGAG
jgi:hypothetical protein